MLLQQFVGSSSINKLHKLCLGDNEGNYRIGSNTFFTNDAGESKVSVTDYATAMVDVAQNAAHVNQYISIAY
ncbi:epimerase [Pseudoalteromonas distincta]|uniref:Epimerase n=1 Tax=Pseudoalteromonas distincta TaxID=77608 RepID=A0ABT9GIW8_9GAMM|nr:MULTISPECIES: epimerase [Pseudoalteromonas distincta group]KHM45458.1 epimerase [Pseudoalteromonas elyakovii]KID40106.1 epimerase [Pseudoalteromonas distincta]MDP4485836.1 epimerase [Pseudoalteromonas elyakovii]